MQDDVERAVEHVQAEVARVASLRREAVGNYLGAGDREPRCADQHPDQQLLRLAFEPPGDATRFKAVNGGSRLGVRRRDGMVEEIVPAVQGLGEIRPGPGIGLRHSGCRRRSEELQDVRLAVALGEAVMPGIRAEPGSLPLPQGAHFTRLGIREQEPAAKNVVELVGTEDGAIPLRVAKARTGWKREHDLVKPLTRDVDPIVHPAGLGIPPEAATGPGRAARGPARRLSRANGRSARLRSRGHLAQGRERTHRRLSRARDTRRADGKQQRAGERLTGSQTDGERAEEGIARTSRVDDVRDGERGNVPNVLCSFSQVRAFRTGRHDESLDAELRPEL